MPTVYPNKDALSGAILHATNLFENGSDETIKNEVESAKSSSRRPWLTWAIYYARSDIVSLLLNMGGIDLGEAQVKDDSPYTPLSMALLYYRNPAYQSQQESYRKIIMSLITNGASLTHPLVASEMQHNLAHHKDDTLIVLLDKLIAFNACSELKKEEKGLLAMKIANQFKQLHNIASWNTWNEIAAKYENFTGVWNHACHLTRQNKYEEMVVLFEKNYAMWRTEKDRQDVVDKLTNIVFKSGDKVAADKACAALKRMAQANSQDAKLTALDRLLDGYRSLYAIHQVRNAPHAIKIFAETAQHLPELSALFSVIAFANLMQGVTAAEQSELIADLQRENQNLMFYYDKIKNLVNINVTQYLIDIIRDLKKTEDKVSLFRDVIALSELAKEKIDRSRIEQLLVEAIQYSQKMQDPIQKSEALTFFFKKLYNFITPENAPSAYKRWSRTDDAHAKLFAAQIATKYCALIAEGIALYEQAMCSFVIQQNYPRVTDVLDALKLLEQENHLTAINREAITRIILIEKNKDNLNSNNSLLELARRMYKYLDRTRGAKLFGDNSVRRNLFLCAKVALLTADTSAAVKRFYLSESDIIKIAEKAKSYIQSHNKIEYRSYPHLTKFYEALINEIARTGQTILNPDEFLLLHATAQNDAKIKEDLLDGMRKSYNLDEKAFQGKLNEMLSSDALMCVIEAETNQNANEIRQPSQAEILSVVSAPSAPSLPEEKSIVNSLYLEIGRNKSAPVTQPHVVYPAIPGGPNPIPASDNPLHHMVWAAASFELERTEEAKYQDGLRRQMFLADLSAVTTTRAVPNVAEVDTNKTSPRIAMLL